ncbi:hypothetical protein AXG93_4773s1180 [Marchantia polymorpha subsp. ruderalis]|uniref:Uncharacterized protein n=2 Tax=Marchantia polymorpha TaxID=3197 RepID=A0A176WL90_MARPO|nr:hypothetical protein AXG93_4773s1180 [Marchantia polymorpha subsp. ruderalis]
MSYSLLKPPPRGIGMTSMVAGGLASATRSAPSLAQCIDRVGERRQALLILQGCFGSRAWRSHSCISDLRCRHGIWPAACMLHVKGTVAHASSGPTALAAANGRRRLLADCHAIEFGHREGEALHELTPLAFEAACSAEVQGSSSTRPLARARCVSGVREDCDALEQVASALALDVELLLVWASSITFVGGRGEEGCTLTQQDLIASAAAQILHLLVRDLEDNRAGSLTSVVDAASLELWGLSCTATAPFYSASCFLQIGADLC